MKIGKILVIAAFAVTATAAFAATPDALIHRWSFNSSLGDTGSLGGADKLAVLGGNAALYGNTSVRVNRGGNNTSYVELGANPIPSSLGDTPFTIEVWATPTELVTYASVFALGERSNSSAKGLMGVFHGFRQINYTGGYGGGNGPVWQAIGGKVNNGTGNNVAMTQGEISTGTPYYFAYVVMPKGDGTSATIIGYVYNASTGEQVGRSTMYTATEWTTALLSQSTFNLGTTPWNNNSPGADYDEVRVWKKALTPGQIATNVALGPDALPGDDGDGCPVLGVSNATLAHRWRFNGSLEDSVTGIDATKKGAYFTADGVIRFPGGSKSDYEVALGADKMPSDSVTLEFFSTVYSLDVWPKMFCLGNGSSENDGISFSYVRGNVNIPDNSRSGLEFKPIGNIGHLGVLEAKKPYHFTFTFSCDGTDTVVKGYCIDLANPGVIKESFSQTLSGWKMRTSISQNTFNLGWSFWNNGAPNADFDEVRVWDGVLSVTEILASATAGADAVITEKSDSSAVLFKYDFSGGTNNFSGIVGDPVTVAPGYTPVHGTSGYGTAVHASGYGTSGTLAAVLAGDWSLAMSFKSCDIEKGVILALGNTQDSQTKQLAICSDGANKLYLALVQNYSSGKNTIYPQTVHASGSLADSFHSLVVTHTPNPNNASRTGMMTFYLDGVQVAQFDSNDNGGERALGNGIRFGALMSSGNPSDYKTTAYHPDVAYRDVRLFTKVLSADEIASYAAMFPAAAATKGDIGAYGFRHDFSSGKLVLSGEGYIDGDGAGANGIVGSGTKASGPKIAGKCTKAVFPSKDGYGMIDGGLNRDWTIAMSVKAPAVASGNAVMFSFGGVEEYTSNPYKKAVAICANSNGGLFAQIVQRYGSGENAINAVGSIMLSSEDLGDAVTNKFHTLVIVNERNITTDDQWMYWNSGMLSFYWDGVYKGSLIGTDGQYPNFADKIRYGGIYNRTINGFAEPSEESGLAFYDLRFIPQVWTSAEAKDYATAFPVAEQSKAHGIIVIVR